MRIAGGIAILVAAVAAIADWRSGKIHNWITLPSIAGAPIAYGFAFGLQFAISSLVSLLLCAAVPYVLFRKGAMGGGDVKLFAALGAATGPDIARGLEIQLLSFSAATVGALAVLVWKGRLITSVVSFVRGRVGREHRSGSSTRVGEPRTSVRLGVPIFVATVIAVLPSLMSRWWMP